MLSFNWHNIRCINSSQQDGFEEFICQLAKKYKKDSVGQFFRNGRPDGGVECYWVCEDGSEICWQAKYFTEAFSPSQWNQINSSVQTALKTHNRLKKYIICFPYDFPDGRNKKSRSRVKSSFDKWNEYKNKWTSDSKKQGMDVEFCFWGNSELLGILQNSDYKSFINFWFDKSFISDAFIDEFNTRMIKNLGPRYFKEMDIDVPFYEIKHWIDRDEVFYTTLNSLCTDVDIALNNLIQLNNQSYSLEMEELSQLWKEFYTEYIKFSDNKCLEKLKVISHTLYETSEELKKKSFNDVDNYEFLEKNEDLLPILDSLNIFLNQNPGNLYEKPYLLVFGDWGTGKSHALASIVEQRRNNGLNSLLFLGQNFTCNDSPEKQILNILDIQCSFADFLEGLDCVAEQRQQRFLIIIDAINEGNGKEIWSNHLANFINKISQYENLGIILSVRSTYLNVFENQLEIVKDKLSRTVINGFSSNYDRAVYAFFNFYHLSMPSIPLLVTEFSNPLFLSIFCKTYENANFDSNKLNRISLSQVFDDFIKQKNEILMRTNDYLGLGNAVEFFIIEFAKRTLDTKKSSLTSEEIRCIYRETCKKFSIRNNFFSELLSENILIKNISSDNNSEEVYLLSYERLLDYAQATYILKNYSGDALIEYLAKHENSYLFDGNHRGLLESLCICSSDKYNKEFLEYVPYSYQSSVFEQYLSAFQWKKSYPNPKLIIEWVEEQIKDYDKRMIFFEKVLLLSIKSDFPFNANYLYEKLFPLTMSDRDSFWTIAACDLYIAFKNNGTSSSISKMISYITENKIDFSDDIVILYSIAFTWLLALPNKDVRDNATKCLVKLLTNNVHILMALIKKFEGINDPYIYERLFAVCYGVLVRSSYIEHGKELGEYIYQHIFQAEEVYPHILLRDYAKQTIQEILKRGIDLNININKILPPYNSKSIDSFPSNEEIDNRYRKTTGEKYICHSMTTEYGRGTGMYGDFGRYIFGYNVSHWKTVDENLLSNLAVKWIFEKYGWTSEKFELFDKRVSSGRSRSNKAEERIGKKYQWLSLYEIMARLADNMPFYSDLFDDVPEKYKGTFETGIRNIDPTLGFYVSTDEYSVELYNITFSTKKSEEWLHDISDIPVLENLIFDTKQNYFCLHSYFKKVDNETGSFDSTSQDKEIWLLLQSYLVKKNDIEQLYKELKNKNFYGRWMPEPYESTKIFSREFYESDAYKYCISDLNLENSEIQNIREIQIIPSVIEYIWEHSLDNSLQAGLHILKPCNFFIKNMDLKQKEKESYFYNSRNELIFFDNGEGQKQPNAMMGYINAIKEFLRNSEYTILWTLLGEKQITNIYDFDTIKYLPTYSQIAYLDTQGKLIQSPMNVFQR